MLVRKRSRRVTAAIAPIETHGSGHAVKGCQRGAPSAVYGYGVAIFCGWTTWSETATASNPAPSAARASSR